MAKERVKETVNLLMAGVVAGFLIGLFNLLLSLLFRAGPLNGIVPSVLILLNASVNRAVLITAAALLILALSFALAFALEASTRTRRFPVTGNKAYGRFLALLSSLAIAYLLSGYRRPIVHLFALVFPARVVRTLRLPLFAVLLACLLSFLLLQRVLGKVDYRGAAGRIRILVGSRAVAWGCAACLVLMLALNISGHALMKRMPNIILITIDTLRQDHLGYFGYGRETSPNIDKLGEDGIVFLQSTSFSDWTLPSHENLLTGRYPVSAVIKRVPPSRELLPEILKRYGYKTAAFVSGEWCKGRYGLNQGFDFFDDHFPDAERKIDEYREQIINWLDTRAKKPFFLWLHLFEPHFPYEGHEDYVYEPSQPTRFDQYNAYFGDDEEMLKLWQNRMELEEKDIERARALYDSEISYIDDYLGRFRHALEKRGLFNSSMIIVTSDHGEGFGEQRVYFHHGYNITEEITRVPLIIKMPGNSPRGKIVEEQVQTSDIFATILDAAGISCRGNILSRNLLPLILGAGSSQRKYAYSYSNETQSYSVRNKKYKLIYYDKYDDYALYDMRSDPHETMNILNDKPEIFREMKKELDAFKQAFLLFASEQRGEKPLEVDEETRKRLKALGYVQ